MIRIKKPTPRLYRRKDSSVWWFAVSYQGRRHVQSTKEKVKAKAKTIANRFVDQLVRSSLPDGTLPAELPASVLFDLFNQKLTKSGRPKNPSTVANYKRYAVNFEKRFGEG